MRFKKQSTFLHYEGMKKNDKGRWVFLGTFSTVTEAREAGATKCKPRYSRST